MKRIRSKTASSVLKIIMWLAIVFSTVIILLFIFLTSVSLIVKLAFGIILILLFYFLFRETTDLKLLFRYTSGFIIICLITICLSQLMVFTPEIRDLNGEIMEGSISEMEKVRINGRDEWITIRGTDIKKPVLVFVSGGPVGSELGWVKRFNSELEKDFIVVVWEEPGGGKSYKAIDFNTVKMDDFNKDLYELTIYLEKKFGVKKIFLAGHSWGSILTITAAKDHPEHYYAVVNIGQMINTVENDRYGYNLSLVAARKANDLKVVSVLEKNGPPPYGRNGFGKYTYYLSNKYGTNTLMNKENKNRDYEKWLYFHGFNIPEYGLLDRAYWFLGLINGMNNIYSPLNDSLNLIVQVPKLDVPVYFANGRHDYNAWYELTEKYFRTLEAPKKEMIWFEDSGHDLNYSEPEKFCELMRRVKTECITDISAN